MLQSNVCQTEIKGLSAEAHSKQSIQSQETILFMHTLKFCKGQCSLGGSWVFLFGSCLHHLGFPEESMSVCLCTSGASVSVFSLLFFFLVPSRHLLCCRHSRLPRSRVTPCRPLGVFGFSGSMPVVGLGLEERSGGQDYVSCMTEGEPKFPVWMTEAGLGGMLFSGFWPD